MWPPKVPAQTWPPELTASIYPPPGPGRNMATRVPCMAQKQTQSSAAFQSMAFPRIRQTLHPWVCLSSQEGVDTAAEFSLGVPSADARGRTGGAHPAAPLCAHSPGHASPRCGVGPAGGGSVAGAGGLDSCQRSGSRARCQGSMGLPVSRTPSPLPPGQNRGVGGRPPLLPAGGHTYGRRADRGTGLGEKPHPGDRHPVANPSLPTPPALSLR